MAHVVVLVLQLSIFLVVLSLGLRSSAGDATYLFRSPALLLRSLLAMNIVMPMVVALAAALLPLHPAVKIALIALAVSPVPPFLPGKELKLVVPERERYVYGLLVASAVLAVVLVPVVISLLAAAFHRDVRVDPLSVARIVAITVLLPLGIGLAVRHFWPAARRVSAPVNRVGMVLLLL
ncbi:MAG TPA: membrane transporter protein, partial [Gammaproteobacteria bacterium]